MTSSSEATVLAGGDLEAVGSVTALRTPELRTGGWTRFGEDSVLGDAVTEQSLAVLAESTRSAARAQGYAVGWAEGRRAAAAQAAEQAAEVATRVRDEDARREADHRASLDRLAAAAAALHGSVSDAVAAVESQAVELALELVRTMLGHELRCASGADVVRRVLAVLPHDAPVATLRLHPADATTPAVTDLAQRGVTVVGDPSLGLGDAVVDTGDQVVDLRFGPALERVSRALLAASPDDPSRSTSGGAR